LTAVLLMTPNVGEVKLQSGLGMIQLIKELGTKLKAAFLYRPIDDYGF
jgi:hypothetical protein